MIRFIDLILLPDDALAPPPQFMLKGHAEETMARLRPKLRICLVASFLYDLPRLYLNVNVFGSLCSFWHNVVKVGFVKVGFVWVSNLQRFWFRRFHAKSLDARLNTWHSWMIHFGPFWPFFFIFVCLEKKSHIWQMSPNIWFVAVWLYCITFCTFTDRWPSKKGFWMIFEGF